MNTNRKRIASGAVSVALVGGIVAAALPPTATQLAAEAAWNAEAHAIGASAAAVNADALALLDKMGL